MHSQEHFGAEDHREDIPDALFAACVAMGCILFLHATLREIFGGNDRERMGYVGGDKTIIMDVDAQVNNLNKVFPVMAKAWEMKLPAINMYAISVVPRGEDRTKEEANRSSCCRTTRLQMSSNSGPSSTICCTPEIAPRSSSTSSTKISAKKEYRHGGGYQEKPNLLHSPRQC